MSRRAALVVGALLLCVASVAVFVAAGTNPNTIGGARPVRSLSDLPVIAKGPQPSLAIGQGWVNSRPLTDADLKGKVVVYDFWTYSCVNCVRTLPYLRAWHERYAEDGLVLVGVHSPEFEFEKDDANVRAAVKRLKVTHPVVFDDDMDLWNAFGNQYWPAKYVTDREGNLRYAHFGEGRYEETEKVLRLLLGVAADAPHAVNPGDRTRSLDPVTPETYLGSVRGNEKHVSLTGRWKQTGEYVESSDAHEELRIEYRAGEVNLVMDRVTRHPTYVVIELDGKPVPPKHRGAHIVERVGVEAEPETVVRIDEAGMYNLVADGPAGNRVLRVRPAGSGVRLYAFTFGD